MKELPGPRSPTAHAYRDDTVRRHWDRGDLASAIREIVASWGRDAATLTIDDLAPLDQFHGGGLPFTRQLARLAGFGGGAHVLDVGGGLGGGARTLAAEFGCRVTVLDLAPSYVEAGRMLTSLLQLEDRVAFETGDALALPYGDGEFDGVWTQNSGMNISDKARLYAGFRRVLRRGGRLAIQEPMAGPNQPLAFPMMWAADATTSHLRTPEEMRAVIEAAGFRTRVWETMVPGPAGPGAPPPEATVQGLVMGTARLAEIAEASRVNDREGRLVMVHAVFDAV
jgi:SAM-dependent methyltransferase